MKTTQVRTGLDQPSRSALLHRISVLAAALLSLGACRDATQQPLVARGEVWSGTIGALSWSFTNVSGARRTIAAIHTSCACTIVEVDIAGRRYGLDRLGAVRSATPGEQQGVAADAAIGPGEKAVFCAGVDTAKKAGELTPRLTVHWAEEGCEPLQLEGRLRILEPATVTPAECVLVREPDSAARLDVTFDVAMHPRLAATLVPTKHSDGLLDYELAPSRDGPRCTVRGHLRIVADPGPGAALELATTDPTIEVRIPLRVRWKSWIRAKQSVVTAAHLGDRLYGFEFDVEPARNGPLLIGSVTQPAGRADFLVIDADMTYSSDHRRATVRGIVRASTDGLLLAPIHVSCVAPHEETLVVSALLDRDPASGPPALAASSQAPSAGASGR